MSARSFAATFAELVTADLARQCRIEGFNAVLDDVPLSQAIFAVTASANARGANYLPDDAFADMEDWIATSVLEAAEEMQAHLDAWDETHLANLKSWRRWTRANPALAKRFGHG